MKEKSLRRHQEFKAKRKSQQAYSSCIGDLPQSEKQALENNIEKLKKVCVSSHLDEEFKKENKKTVQEMKHEISMKEQIELT